MKKLTAMIFIIPAIANCDVSSEAGDAQHSAPGQQTALGDIVGQYRLILDTTQTEKKAGFSVSVTPSFDPDEPKKKSELPSGQAYFLVDVTDADAASVRCTVQSEQEIDKYLDAECNLDKNELVISVNGKTGGTVVYRMQRLAEADGFEGRAKMKHAALPLAVDLGAASMEPVK